MDIDTINKHILESLKPHIGEKVVDAKESVKRAMYEQLQFLDQTHDWNVRIVEMEGTKVTVAYDPPEWLRNFSS